MAQRVPEVAQQSNSRNLVSGFRMNSNISDVLLFDVLVEIKVSAQDARRCLEMAQTQLARASSSSCQGSRSIIQIKAASPLAAEQLMTY